MDLDALNQNIWNFELIYLYMNKATQNLFLGVSIYVV